MRPSGDGAKAFVSEPFADSCDEKPQQAGFPNGEGLHESSKREQCIQASSSTSLTTYLEPEAVPVAPESVHLQLNNVCNLRRPSCYVKLQKEDSGRPPTERWMTLVDEIADIGVFQLALGGGEQLDVASLCRHCSTLPTKRAFPQRNHQRAPVNGALAKAN